jgi:hypothetical protein
MDLLLTMQYSYNAYLKCVRCAVCVEVQYKLQILILIFAITKMKFGIEFFKDLYLVPSPFISMLIDNMMHKHNIHRPVASLIKSK